MSSGETCPMVIANCTHLCNLRCDHCYCSASPDSQNTLTASSFEGVLRDLLAMGIVNPPYFDLTGGEFVLCPDAEAISEMVRQAFPDTCIIVETNGLAILTGTCGYDRLQLDRIHVSIDKTHGNLLDDGSSPVLERTLAYATQRELTVVVNHIPETDGGELPDALLRAEAAGARINVFKRDTLARMGRGTSLKRESRGTRVMDAPEFFRCELGEAVHLDADGSWYLCHYPVRHNLIGKTQSATLAARYQEATNSDDYLELVQCGLARYFERWLAQLPSQDRCKLEETRFHNRCEPCLALQRLGMLRFWRDRDGE